MSPVTSTVIQLHLSADDFTNYYRGLLQTVTALDQNGKTIRFPAAILQRFVTTEGISGTFRLTYDDNNKFVSIERV